MISLLGTCLPYGLHGPVAHFNGGGLWSDATCPAIQLLIGHKGCQGCSKGRFRRLQLTDGDRCGADSCTTPDMLEAAKGGAGQLKLSIDHL